MFNDFDVFYDNDNRCYQVRTKINTYALDFDDDIKRNIFEQLIDTPKDTLPKMFAQLSQSFEKDKVLDVFHALNDYGLLPPQEIACIEELNSTTDEGSPYSGPELLALEENKVLIISDTQIGENLKQIARDNELKSVQLIGSQQFAEASEDQVNVLMGENDFIFYDASRWNPAAVDRLNKAAIQHHTPWLHIGGFEENLLKLGPLFLGDETGCYDCFIKRMKSNYEHVEFMNSYEKHLRSSHTSSKPDKFIHEGAYLSILANMAYVEFTKFAQMWYVPSTWKKLLVINALNFETQSHDLLKVPFCETCNEQHEFNPAPWLEPISIY